jgi:CRP-like cAMP-binding protein
VADDMLRLSEHLPEISFAPGDAVVREGGQGRAIYVLVSGSLVVRKSGVVVNTITHPGAVIGEMSVLLDAAHGATVEALEPSRLRVAEDGAALLASDPAITAHVARGLAERLAFATAYLADLKQQYADTPGMAMVSDVLARLSAQQGPRATPGSARDPDPEY